MAAFRPDRSVVGSVASADGSRCAGLRAPLLLRLSGAAMKIGAREVPKPALAHWQQALDDAPRAALEALDHFLPRSRAGFHPGEVPSPAHHRQSWQIG